MMSRVESHITRPLCFLLLLINCPSWPYVHLRICKSPLSSSLENHCRLHPPETVSKQQIATNRHYSTQMMK